MLVRDMKWPDQAMDAARDHIHQAEVCAERLTDFESRRAQAHAGIAIAYMELADRLRKEGA